MASETLRSEEEIIASWSGDITKPVVSIRCSTFNHVLYIEETIKSFLSQETDFPIEIWIHDDASTDGTDKIVKQYRDAYPNIINAICQIENQYSKGVRIGAMLSKHCKGEYLALCEGDDYWVGKDKLVKQREAMIRNPGVDLCIHPGVMLDVKNNTTYKKFWHGPEEAILEVGPIAESLTQFSPTASYFFKREAYENMPEWYLNGKNIPFGDYFVETIIGKNGVIYIPDSMCVYRRNVAGSYTVRTQVAKADVLVARLEAVIKFTKKMYEIKEIPNSAITKRLKVVHDDYLNMAVTRQSYNMARRIIESARTVLGNDDYAKGWQWKSALGFKCYAIFLNFYRKFKKRVVRFLR